MEEIRRVNDGNMEEKRTEVCIRNRVDYFERIENHSLLSVNYPVEKYYWRK